MSSTFFTAAPHWRWLIVAYFFLGGLAGGSYFLATMMDLFGKSEDRSLVRLAYLIAFPAVCVCGLLLTADLGRPERFWHMLVQAQTFRPMIKAYSPMSIGSWALLLFSGCAFLSFVAVLAERGWLSWPPLLRLSPPAPLGRLVTAVGALLGLYLAGYTGVLLAVTNRPIWADTTLLGLTFLISAASTSAALLILLGSFGGGSRDGIRALERLDASVLVLEGLAIAALVASLGRVAMVWLNGWGLLLAGVMLGGIGLPLLLHWRRPSRDSRWWIGPALVLLGGLTLRVVVVFSSDGL
jgi:protein NrfD